MPGVTVPTDSYGVVVLSSVTQGGSAAPVYADQGLTQAVTLPVAAVANDPITVWVPPGIYQAVVTSGNGTVLYTTYWTATATASTFSVTGAVVAGSGPGFYLVNASSGPMTVSVTATAPVAGTTFTIKKTDSSSNPVTIVPMSPGMIDSNASVTLPAPGSSVTLQAMGSGAWFVQAAGGVTATFVTPEFYGAKGNGVADDTAAVQAAITACPAGSSVLLTKNYAISSPIVIPANKSVIGLDVGLYGATSSWRPQLTVLSTFVGTAAVMSNDTTGGIVYFSGVLINGAALGYVSSVKGLYLPGTSTGPVWHCTNIVAANFPGGGIQVGTPGGLSRGGTFTDCVGWYATGADAWSINVTDAHFTRCMGFGSANGWHITQATNAIFTACRAEHNTQGYWLDNAYVTSSTVFDGCTSDQNDHDGFFANALRWGFSAYGGALKVTGCSFHRDGNNVGAGSTTYAGMRLTNNTVPVLVEATTVGASRGDSTGVGPAYGLVVAGNTAPVVVNGGSFVGAVAPIVDLGGNTAFTVTPYTVQGIRSPVSGTETGSYYTSPAAAPILYPRIVQSAMYTTTSTTLGGAVTLASTPTPGNMLVFAVSFKAAVGTSVTPGTAGWTAAVSVTNATANTDNDGLMVWTRPATSSDTASQTFSIAGVNDYAAAVLYEIANVNPTTPVNQVGVVNTAAATTLTTPSLTPTTLRCLPLSFGGQTSAQTITPSGSFVIDQAAASSYHPVYAAHGPLTADTVTAISETYTSGSSIIGVMALLLLTPAT